MKSISQFTIVTLIAAMSLTSHASNFSQFFSGGSKTLMGQEFTASGTWTRPTGVNFVDVECIGGGGGGGNGGTLDYNGSYAAYGGTGGSSGVYVKAQRVPVSSNITVTIGAGGAAGADGATSSFGTLAIAPGGARGSGGGYTNGSVTIAGATRGASGALSQSADSGSISYSSSTGFKNGAGGSVLAQGGSAGSSSSGGGGSGGGGGRISAGGNGGNGSSYTGGVGTGASAAANSGSGGGGGGGCFSPGNGNCTAAGAGGAGGSGWCKVTWMQ